MNRTINKVFTATANVAKKGWDGMGSLGKAVFDGPTGRKMDRYTVKMIFAGMTDQEREYFMELFWEEQKKRQIKLTHSFELITEKSETNNSVIGETAGA